MVEVIIHMVRTSGKDLAAYTLYRQQYDQNYRQQYMDGGRKGGSGNMKIKTSMATQPYPTNVIYEETI